jgi:hypothetical protein
MYVRINKNRKGMTDNIAVSPLSNVLSEIAVDKIQEAKDFIEKSNDGDFISIQREISLFRDFIKTQSYRAGKNFLEQSKEIMDSIFKNLNDSPNIEKDPEPVLKFFQILAEQDQYVWMKKFFVQAHLGEMLALLQKSPDTKQHLKQIFNIINNWASNANDDVKLLAAEALPSVFEALKDSPDVESEHEVQKIVAKLEEIKGITQQKEQKDPVDKKIIQVVENLLRYHHSKGEQASDEDIMVKTGDETSYSGSTVNTEFRASIHNVEGADAVVTTLGASEVQEETSTIFHLEI